MSDPHHEKIQLTVALTTFNGGTKLERTLASLIDTTLDQSKWKLIVVDNASTDNSSCILRKYAEHLPLEILYESRPGKGEALNTAFRHLQGNLTVLIDDDVLPSPDWLGSYLKIAKEKPDFDIFSGKILPEWETEPPEWILSNIDLASMYAINADLPDGEISPHKVFGPNCAFRTSILPMMYTILENEVGPNNAKSEYAMGGDTALSVFLANRGHRCFHTTKVQVRHIIPARYLTEQWIMRRAQRFGRGFVHAHPDKITVGLRTLRPRLKIMQSLLLLISRFPRNSVTYKLLWRLNWYIGFYSEYLDLR